MRENVKEWTHTLPSGLPLWELESLWNIEFLERDLGGQNSLNWKFSYIIGIFLKCRCVQWLWDILAHPQHEDMHSQTRLKVELLCSCSLTSKVVQCNAMKFTKNLMRCVHLEDTKTLWENRNSPWWNVKGHYVDVHSMSRLMVEPLLFHSS
jgi:hypothetical protein